MQQLSSELLSPLMSHSTFKWTGNAFNCNFSRILTNKKKEVALNGKLKRFSMDILQTKPREVLEKKSEKSTETLDMTRTNRRIVFHIEQFMLSSP